MNRIHQQWGATIQEACKYSTIPQEFVAALIANESGGAPDAKRFEPGVYKHLCAVRDGREPRYGNLTAETLPSEIPRSARNDNAGGEHDTLRAWATSWGLTQMMGYHVARRPGGIAMLLDPVNHLKFALGMLAQFASQYALDLQHEAAELFRCWNTGGPYGKTADLEYVQRGLARMEIYREQMMNDE